MRSRGSAKPIQSELTCTLIGAMDMAKHRRLCHATMHTGLDNIHKKRRVTTARITSVHEDPDHGYIIFHKVSRPDTLAPAYRDRVSAAVSIAAGSVKLQWLSGVI